MSVALRVTRGLLLGLSLFGCGSSSDSNATTMCIVVVDRGGGIAAEHLDKVFEPLVSTKQELPQNNAQRLSHDRQHVCMFVHRNLARPSADGRRRAELRTPRSPAEASELTLLFHV